MLKAGAQPLAHLAPAGAHLGGARVAPPQALPDLPQPLQRVLLRQHAELQVPVPPGQPKRVAGHHVGYEEGEGHVGRELQHLLIGGQVYG